MKIKLTEFALRHFDPKFGGTKILDHTPEEFGIHINNEVCYVNDHRNNSLNIEDLSESDCTIIEGYAPFCKLIPIKKTYDGSV